jgi:hypothetical protein
VSLERSKLGFVARHHSGGGDGDKDRDQSAQRLQHRATAGGLEALLADAAAPRGHGQQIKRRGPRRDLGGTGSEEDVENEMHRWEKGKGGGAIWELARGGRGQRRWIIAF